MTQFLRFKISALCGLIALTATSCGNYMGGKSVQVSSDGVYYGATADLSGLSGNGTSTLGNYTCPNSPNALPNSDSSAYSSAGKYSVCWQSSDISKIAVHGTTQGSNGICVFPIQYIDSSHVYFKPDVTTGLPYNSCATIGASSSTTNSSVGSALEFAFSGMSYNAVFIVDDADKYAMQMCLSNGSSGGCPVYSYGKFR